MDCPKCGGNGWNQVWDMFGNTEQQMCEECNGTGKIDPE